MEAKGRKYIALFLVFSLMMLSVNLYAKKRGATIVITKKDGTQFQGELITVKQNSLLILVPSGKDVSFDIADIEVIRIVKKSGVSLGAGIGGTIGLGVGLYRIMSTLISSYKVEGDASLIPHLIIGGLAVPVAMSVGAIVGAAIGGGVGALVRGHDVIYLTGMTDSEIQEALDKLRKKARIPDYK